MEEWKDGRIAEWQDGSVYDGRMEWPFSASVENCLHADITSSNANVPYFSSFTLFILESAKKCVLLRAKGIMHVHVHVHTHVYTHASYVQYKSV